MTKKITFMLLVVLILSAFVFVSCEQEAGGASGGGGGKPTPPKTKDPVVNVHGTEAVLVLDNFESELYKTSGGGEGASTEIAEGAGRTGDALFVQQQETYGQVAIDITKYYARGKSYYVEAWFKNNGSTNTEDLTAYIDFSLITGAGINYSGPTPYGTTHKPGETWDIPGQYDGSWMADDAAWEIFEIETNVTGESIDDTEWHKVSGILDAEGIEAMIKSQDEQCHATEESTLYEFKIIFLVGTYASEESGKPGQSGYNYYLDDIKIVDLNSELDAEGKTYEEPEVEDTGDSEGDSEGGDD